MLESALVLVWLTGSGMALATVVLATAHCDGLRCRTAAALVPLERTCIEVQLCVQRGLDGVYSPFPQVLVVERLVTPV